MTHNSIIEDHVMTEQEALKRADAGFLAVLGKVDKAQWMEPSLNPGWTVAYLARHIMEGIVWVEHVLSGATIEAAGDQFNGDLFGDDPQGAGERACAQAEAAVSRLTDPEATVHLSYGDVPAHTYLREQIIDITIHTWDLARSVGADDKIDPDLAEAVYEWFAPEAELWRRASMLKPAVPTPADADTQTKLLALSGRQV